MENFGELKEENIRHEESKRTSGLVRVAGVSPEEESRILEEKAETFEDRKIFRFRKERNKTPAEEEIIAQVLSYLPEFIKKYGGRPVPLEPEHISIFEYKDVSEELKKRKLSSIKGSYNNRVQAAGVIIDSEKEHELVFAQRMVHELIHFSAFQSADPPDKKTKKMSKIHRIEGLLIKVHDKKGDDEIYFRNWNEAITEELAIRFDNEYFKLINALSELLEYREKYRNIFSKKHPEISPGDVIRETANIISIKIKSTMRLYPGESPGMRRLTTESYAFEKERKDFYRIMRDIAEKHKDRFSSPEEVFKIFAKSYFTGKILPIARLVEQTYGKGSFRKIGEEGKLDPRDFEDSDSG